MTESRYQKVIIIGAPRSGTNMLRDVLCSLDGVDTWPCDEINYIWRHGNIRVATDQFSAKQATPGVVRYIRKQFDKCATEKTKFLVEKTCANSLRVAFVDSVVPDAKFIFIVRDGLDAIGSAKLRWTAKLDIPYLVEKSKFVPLMDVPYYAVRYFWNRIYRLFARDNRLAFWGPQLTDMQALLRTKTLEEVCAIQWRECVELADRDLSGMSQDKVCFVKYEKFVDNPVEELKRISNFLALPINMGNLEKATKSVSSGSVGRGRTALSKEVAALLMPHISETLRKFDYEC